MPRSGSSLCSLRAASPPHVPSDARHHVARPEEDPPRPGRRAIMRARITWVCTHPCRAVRGWPIVCTTMGSPGGSDPSPRPPSLLDAIAPIVVLILLIALTIVTFGVSATDGPLQVALMLSAAFASLVALKNGYTSAALADAAIGGVT